MNVTKARNGPGQLSVAVLAMVAGAVVAACSATAATPGSGSNTPSTANPAKASAVAAHSAAAQPLFGAPSLFATPSAARPVPATDQAQCSAPPKEAPQPVGGCQAPTAIQPHPPARFAAIAFCGTLRSDGPQQVGAQAVCGIGFGPSELVTLALSGRFGTTYWTTVATAGGTFHSALPSSACRFSPGSLIATGNHGSASNTLAIPLIRCRMGL